MNPGALDKLVFAVPTGCGLDTACTPKRRGRTNKCAPLGANTPNEPLILAPAAPEILSRAAPAPAACVFGVLPARIRSSGHSPFQEQQHRGETRPHVSQGKTTTLVFRQASLRESSPPGTSWRRRKNIPPFGLPLVVCRRETTFFFFGIGGKDVIKCNNEKLVSGSSSAYVKAARDFLASTVFGDGVVWPAAILAPSDMEPKDSPNLPTKVSHGQPLLAPALSLHHSRGSQMWEMLCGGPLTLLAAINSGCRWWTRTLGFRRCRWKLSLLPGQGSS